MQNSDSYDTVTNSYSVASSGQYPSHRRPTYVPSHDVSQAGRTLMSPSKPAKPNDDTVERENSRRYDHFSTTRHRAARQSAVLDERVSRHVTHPLYSQPTAASVATPSRYRYSDIPQTSSFAGMRASPPGSKLSNLQRKDSDRRESSRRDSNRRDSDMRDMNRRDSDRRDSERRDNCRRDSDRRDSGRRESDRRDSGRRDSDRRDSQQYDDYDDENPSFGPATGLFETIMELVNFATPQRHSQSSRSGQDGGRKRTGDTDDQSFWFQRDDIVFKRGTRCVVSSKWVVAVGIYVLGFLFFVWCWHMMPWTDNYEPGVF